MKYCIQYKKNFKYLNDVDEITINFRASDTTLVDFLLLHQKQRINIYIDDEDDFINNDRIKLFSAIALERPEIHNFVFKLKDYKRETTKKIVEIIKSSKMKYFFEVFVRDWDTLLGYVELHPSDIYVVENLGFEIAAVAQLLHVAGIQVRCFPNVGQSAWKWTPALKKFFIRPEDVHMYEPYIDVLEFFGREDSIETYYKIYAIDKKWFGKLNEVIIDFDDKEIDSRFILPKFAVRRLNCGKHCLKGRPCKVCEAIKELAEVLESNNIMLKTIDK